MEIKLLRRAGIFVAAIALFLCPIKAFSCGPFIEQAVFSYDYHPDFPLRKFAEGELGVLQSTYARSYLFAAYRQLSDQPLTAEEQKAIVTVWEDRLGNASDTSQAADAAKAWVDARNKVASVKIQGELSTERSVIQEESYNTYLNCNADAFVNATDLLREKIAKYGAASNQVKDWVKAQDEVFSHCTGPAYHYETKKIDAEPAFPQPAPSTADATVKAERAYQIAAANFYAQHFDQAQKEFAEIGKDQSSPYAKIAPYLVARCQIRKATLAKTLDSASLQNAWNTLSEIAQNPKADTLRQSAQELMRFVAFRLHPETRLAELGKELVQPQSANMLSREINDYTMLLDKYLNEDSDAPADLKSTKKKIVPAAALSDLTDWILAVQGKDDPSKREALKKWKSTRSTLWLVPALMNVQTDTAGKDELIEAALKMPASSPAYPTVRYHAIRLLIAAGKKEEANKCLAEVLSATKNNLPPSAFNCFMDEKMELAKTLDEYWQDGLRASAGSLYDRDGLQVPEDLDKIEKSNGFFTGPVSFTDTATEVLNEYVPLNLLTQVARSSKMPPPIQLNVWQALWTRAILIDDAKAASALTAALINAQPLLRQVLKEYVSASDPDLKNFLSVYAFVKNPAMRPYITAGVQRPTAFNQIDQYQDNWWCGFTPSHTDTETPPPEPRKVKKPNFLTAAQLSPAKIEHEKLLHAGPGPTYILKQLISYADKPGTKDARLPEALYLAIRSPKFGCTDKSTTGLSKAAFQILHKKYPNDPFTQKTKYWY